MLELILFCAIRLVDLGDENITELKLSEQLTKDCEQELEKKEAGVDTAAKMAENTTGESTLRVIYCFDSLNILDRIDICAIEP